MQFRKWKGSDQSHLLYVGIFLGRNISIPSQLHMGYLVRDEANEIRFIHLAFHHNLRNDRSQEIKGIVLDEMVWERCLKLDDDEGQQVFGLRLIECAANPEVPYSFLYNANPYFDSSLTYLDGEPGRGLTCSTFVLATWEAFGYGPLLAAEEWVPRAGDDDNREIILAWLRDAADDDHVKAIENNIHVIRFRPEEVSAGATSTETPLGLASAVERAQAILAALN